MKNTKLRLGASGIVIREDGNIAVFNKSNKNEYKLPGGGLEKNEIPEEAFKREISEETGCEVEIIEQLGITEEYKSLDNFKQCNKKEKVMKKKRFKKIYIEITNICNLSCSFCEPDNRKKEYMSEEKFKTIIKKIKPYTEYIYLHVKGEPLLHPKINEFIKIANEANIKVNITTNGTLLDNLKNRDIRQINYSIQSSKKIDEIQETIRKLKEIQKESDIYISLRMWRDDTKNNVDIIKMLKQEFPEVEEIKDRIVLDKNIFLSLEEEFEWPDINKEEEQKRGYCYGLIDQIGILVDGTVIPCCLDHKGVIKLGNIYTQNLEDIIESTKVKNIVEGFRNRNIVESLCKKCKYRLRF